MHVVLKRDVLYEAVLQVAKAVSSATTIPILSGIHISVSDEECVLTGSDADLTIRTTIPRYEEDDELYTYKKTGQIVLPAKYFTDIVRKLAGETIELEIEEPFITHIRSGQAEFQLNGLDAEEYPRLPQLEEEQTFSVPASLLKNMIRQTAFAVSTKETRPILTGVLWTLNKDQFQLVATDSHRLSQSKTSVSSNPELTFDNMVIPGKSVQELQRMLDDDEQEVDIVIAQNQMMLQNGNHLFLTRLLEGTYPDTERIIPNDSQTTLVLDKKPLSQAIERASLLAKDGKHLVQLSIVDEHTLQIASNTPEVGRVTEQVHIRQTDGEPFKIVFNAKYMIEALRATEDDEIRLEFTGSMSPFMIKPLDTDNLLHLVLPVRTY